MAEPAPQVCVVICTCDRHAMLGDLLTALAPQLAAAGARLIVTDNGQSPAQAVVEPCRAVAPTTYLRLSERGLVAARNAGLGAALTAGSDFIAFIDDDELPEAGWLENLVRSIGSTQADIACGPLEPQFLTPPPAWAQKGPFFRKAGTAIGTGNIIFRASIVPRDPTQWFQPAFAFIGGEDEEFFARLIGNGARFTTAANALVHEFIPEVRMRIGYMASMGLRDGMIETSLHRQRGDSLLTRTTAAARHASMKFAYGANHLFWSWRHPWRSVAALRDFAEAAGTVAGAAGLTRRFYGGN